MSDVDHSFKFLDPIMADQDMDAYSLSKPTSSSDSSVPGVFLLTPPSSPKVSGVLAPSDLGKKRRKPNRKHPAAIRESVLPRCGACGAMIDLNELFNLHSDLKKPLPEKKSRPANQKTKENFALWRNCVFEVTGARAPVKSGQPEYAKVKALYESRAPKCDPPVDTKRLADGADTDGELVE